MKILLLRNNIKDLDTLNQGVLLVKQYASTIGLTLDFTFADTPKQFTGYSFSNAPNNEGYVSGVEITPQEVFDEAKRLGYVFDIDSIACLVFDATKINPSPTNPIDNGVCIQIPCQWYATYPDVFASFFLHELCHYDAQKNNVPDLTHLKYNPMWGNRWSQRSDVDYYLFLLQRYVKPPVISPTKPQNALYGVLTRDNDNGVQTIGTLKIGDLICKTLERTWLNNQRNISCIPKGIYQVKWTFSWRMLKYTYELQSVSGRSGVRIHSGNLFTDSDGCILVGDSYRDINNDGQVDVLNSKKTLQKLETLLNKQPFLLEIK